jgi:hypothetical protein
MTNPISSRSRTSDGHKAPATLNPKRAGDFLLELVNLREQDQQALSRFMQKFADLLPAVPKKLSQQDRIRSWHEQLRQAWGTPEFIAVHTGRRSPSGYVLIGTKRRPDAAVAWDRRGRLLSNLGFYTFSTEGPDGFFRALEYACQIASKMRRCANAFPHPHPGQLVALGDPGRARDLSNRPECPTPYFIAKRKTQNFCSDICAVVGQRESNLRWWRRRGIAMRKEKAAERRGRQQKEKSQRRRMKR